MAVDIAEVGSHICELRADVGHRGAHRSQYLGILGSIFSAQARIPPARFFARVKPC